MEGKIERIDCSVGFNGFASIFFPLCLYANFEGMEVDTAVLLGFLPTREVDGPA